MRQNKRHYVPTSALLGETNAGALLVAVLVSALLLVLICPPQAMADPDPTSVASPESSESAASVTSADKRAEAEAVLSSLNAMQVTLDELSNEYGEALAVQEEAEANRDAAEAQLAVLSSKVTVLQERLRAHAREMYRSGGVTYLDALLKANSFKQFATNWEMLDTVNATVADMVVAKKNLAEEEKRQAAVFSEQAALASEKAAEAESAAMKAQETIAEMQATYESLSEEALQLLEEERKAQQAQEAARAHEVLAAAAAAAQSDGGSQEAGSLPDGATGAGVENQGNVAAGSPGSDAATEPAPAPTDTVAPETDNASPAGSANETAATDSTDASGSGTDTADTAGGDSAGQDAHEGSSTGQEADSASYEGGSDTVSRAYACLGAPYVWGGVGPQGYDCSGLVSYCLSGSHTRLGTTYTFMTWPRVSNPQPGDIAVNNSHTGVYIGNGQMIHAATYGVGVIVGPVQSGMVFVRYGG